MGAVRFNKRGLGLLLAAGLWLAVVAPVQADTDSIDQVQQSASGGTARSTPMAQTFTAGLSGGVDRVLLMIATPYGSATVTVQIQSVSGGKPSGTVLGSSSFTGTVLCCRKWHEFVMSPAAPVVATTHYAIVVTPTSGALTWYANYLFDGYLDNQLWLAPSGAWQHQAGDGFDFCFQTYVQVGVANQAPPTVTITGASGNGPEGTPIVLTGHVTSASAGDITAGFTLTWKVTKDGELYTAGSGASLTVTPDDEGTFVATLQADDASNSLTTSVTFTGANVAPTAVISGVTYATLILVTRQPVTINGGFTDPGALDTHTGTFDYGDGTPPEVLKYGVGGSGVLDEDYAYSVPRTYTVTYQVTDDDGGTSTATATVTVMTLADALARIDAYVQSMASLNAGEKDSLSDKVEQIIKSLDKDKDNTKETCNKVDAFLNELAARTRDHKLSDADSTALSQSMWSVHRALGCTKVKVGWAVLNL